MKKERERRQGMHSVRVYVSEREKEIKCLRKRTDSEGDERETGNQRDKQIHRQR